MPAIILSWAELTSMLSCNGSSKHHPHPYHRVLENFQGVGVINCMLGGGVCEALSL